MLSPLLIPDDVITWRRNSIANTIKEKGGKNEKRDEANNFFLNREKIVIFYLFDGSIKEGKMKEKEKFERRKKVVERKVMNKERVFFFLHLAFSSYT